MMRPAPASDMALLVRAFHERMGVEPGQLDDAAFVRLRQRLAVEEHSELMDELALGNRVGVAQELADVVVVAYGTADLLGIDLDAVLGEVMRANLSKAGTDGPVFRPDGKVMKPPGFRPADVAAVLDGPCCGLHRTDCCDPDDCGPCCTQCPTCPALTAAGVR